MGHIVSRKQPQGRTQVQVSFPTPDNSPHPDHVVLELSRRTGDTRASLNLEELDELILILSYYRKEMADAIEENAAREDFR